MSQYLDNEAIARALRLTPEAVEAILNGSADIAVKDEDGRDGGAQPSIYVSTVKTSYRQKIISVVRGKGGVGCTVVALGLAYLLSGEIKTLLLGLSPEEGISDLVYYLSLDSAENYAAFWPEASVFSGRLDTCEVRIAPNFDVLELKEAEAKNAEAVAAAVSTARQNYDAVVIDTPNRADEAYVAEAVSHSNVLVGITNGLEPELLRLAHLLNSYPQKDAVVVANMCPEPRIEEFEGMEIVRLEHDPSLAKAFKKCDLPGLKSPFMKGMARIKDAVYGRQQKGLLRGLLGR